MSTIESLREDVVNLEKTFNLLVGNFNDHAAAPIAQVVLDQNTVARRNCPLKNMSEIEVVWDRSDTALRILPTLPQAVKEYASFPASWRDLSETRTVLWNAVLEGFIWSGRSFLADPPGWRDPVSFERCVETLIVRQPLSPDERKALAECVRARFDKLSLSDASVVRAALRLFLEWGQQHIGSLSEQYEESVIEQFLITLAKRASFSDIFTLMSFDDRARGKKNKKK